MYHPALEEYVSQLIADNDLAAIETRTRLREVQSISRMTQWRREQAADLKPVAHIKNCPAFATREYLLGCFEFREEKPELEVTASG